LLSESVHLPPANSAGTISARLIVSSEQIGSGLTSCILTPSQGSLQSSPVIVTSALAVQPSALVNV